MSAKGQQGAPVLWGLGVAAVVAMVWLAWPTEPRGDGHGAVGHVTPTGPSEPLGEQAPASASPSSGRASEALEARTPDEAPAIPEVLDPDAITFAIEIAIIEGKITRETHPTSYDAAIYAIAGNTAERSFRTFAESNAADYLGFKSWSAFERELDALTVDDPAMAAELETLGGEALGVANYVAECVADAWARRQYLEVWPHGAEHDTWAWREANPRPEGGVMSTETSVSAGDLAFRLHFSSFDYPLLDQQLVDLRSKKADWWVRRKGL